MAEARMRPAVGQFNELLDEKLRYAAQLGVGGIQMNTPKFPGDVRWEAKDIRAAVLKCQEFNLVFEAIENVPIHFYQDAMLGGPKRDEQIENYRHTIRAVAEGGVPILGYHWMPNSVWRTALRAPGRGGAGCTAFTMSEVEKAAGPDGIRGFVAKTDEKLGSLAVAEQVICDADQLWENYVYFMKAVLPVAEEVGVKLALHPDDPPVPMLGGVARIFREPAGFKRAYELNPNSPSWGLDLCLGCCSEMPGGAANVKEMIEFFGPKGKIHYIHFRDVIGTVPDFRECFIGEGNYDPAEIIVLLKKSGFTGFILDDHVPHMDDDTPYCHRGRAHAIGYAQGLIRMLDLLG